MKWFFVMNGGLTCGAPRALQEIEEGVARIYVMNIQFIWDEAKRLSNIKNHGFDFMDVPGVFAGLTLTVEDDRFDYGEQRWISLDYLRGTPVSIVHTENEIRIRVISFRKATRREEKLLYDGIKN